LTINFVCLINNVGGSNLAILNGAYEYPSEEDWEKNERERKTEREKDKEKEKEKEKDPSKQKGKDKEKPSSSSLKEPNEKIKEKDIEEEDVDEFGFRKYPSTQILSLIDFILQPNPEYRPNALQVLSFYCKIMNEKFPDEFEVFFLIFYIF
jgi:hypothetical protein